jgi:hypothetical protein
MLSDLHMYTRLEFLLSDQLYTLPSLN